MSININSSIAVKVNGAPAIAASSTVAAEAYDEVIATIPAATDSDTPGKLNLEVQPSASERIKFLLIGSNVLDPRLKYSIQGEGEGEPAGVSLDSVQIFNGAGMMGLLGDDPKTFSFSNGTDREANVRILVGRQASAPPA